MGRINKYSKELKLKVVHEYIKGIKSLGNIAYELGCCKETVRGWVMMYNISVRSKRLWRSQNWDIKHGYLMVLMQVSND